MESAKLDFSRACGTQHTNISTRRSNAWLLVDVPPGLFGVIPQHMRASNWFYSVLGTCFLLALVDLAGDFDAAEAVHVFGDAAIEGVGDALAVFRGLKLAFVVRIADERNLGED